MKILAIRGENIASIERFDVDLAGSKLKHAGLFAITGPTGSGKSTILDALCLALFDKTPRLRKKSDVRVGATGPEGNAGLTVTDVRNLLRRGAGAGFAEVDFMGVDGRAYRARWSVWRARRRPNGTIQPQTLSLVDLHTNENVGDTRRTETAKIISQRLGLTFDQFRRSALLAQGDFAAFLRAGEGERADLLEAMTGTEIYGKLSKAAFDRAKAEAAALASLVQRLEDTDLLSADDRASAEQAQGDLQAALDHHVERKARATDWVAWHDRGATLAAELRQADAARDAARAQLAALADTQQELAHVEQVASLRPILDRADERQAQLGEQRAALGRLEQEQGEAARQHAHAVEAARASQGAAEAAEAALRDAGPHLRAASALDTRLVAAATEVEKVHAQLSTQRATATAAAQELAALDQALRQAEATGAAARGWLDAHPRDAALAAGAVGWEPLLARLVTTLPVQAEAKAAIEAATPAAERAAAAVVASTAHAAASAQRVQELRVAASEAKAQAVEHPLAPLLEEQATLGQRRLALNQLLGTLATLGKCLSDQGRDQELLQKTDALLEAAAGEQQEAADAVDELDARIEEAERMARMARAQVDITTHRRDLRAGEPCPLCGATEHPRAHDLPATATIIDAAEARVKELQGARDAQVRRGQAARTRRISEGQRRRDLRDAIDARAQETDRLQAAAADARAELGLPTPAGDDGTPAVGAALEAVEAAVAAVHAAQKVARAAQAGSERAQAELEGALRDDADAQRKVQHAQTAHTQAKAALDQATREGQRLTDQVRSIEGLLAPHFDPLEGWQEDVRARPEAFAQARHDAVAAVRAQQERLEAAAAVVAERRQQRGALEAAHAGAERAVQESVAEHTERSGQHSQLLEERAGCLGGRPTAEVQAELEQRVSATRAEQAEAKAAVSTAEAAVAHARGLHTQAQRAVADAETRHTEAATQLEGALAEVALDLPTVRARLARPAAWVEQTRATLQQAHAAVQRAQTVRDERQRLLEGHQQAQPAPIPPPRQGEADGGSETVETEAGAPAPAAGPPEAPAPAEAQGLLEAATHAVDTATQALADVRARLRQDDARHARAEALVAERDAQQAAADHWKTLSDLIGSSDGKKLRTFAQSLTLDALLVEAGLHLRELAPRYSVRRVPNHDLEIQVVDHDMADEVRAVHSLSGGEGFLVSLALALGLASLTAQDTSVETLFIDEGFGTLDAQTLELALHTLDQLQSQGRQVGLISHVPGLAERIGVQVKVEPRGNGRSQVRVVAPDSA